MSNTNPRTGFRNPILLPTNPNVEVARRLNRSTLERARIREAIYMERGRHFAYDKSSESKANQAVICRVVGDILTRRGKRR